MRPTHMVVKLYGAYSTIVYVGLRDECREHALAKNQEYQTDAYRVKEYRPKW